MNKLKKILSVAMSCALALTMFVLPVGATVTPDTKVQTALELVKENDMPLIDNTWANVIKASESDGDVYKLVVKVNTNNTPLIAMNIGITYDNTKLNPLAGNKIAPGFDLNGADLNGTLFAVYDVDLNDPNVEGMKVGARPVGQLADAKKKNKPGKHGPAAINNTLGVFTAGEGTIYDAARAAHAGADGQWRDILKGQFTGITVPQAENIDAIMLQWFCSTTDHTTNLRTLNTTTFEPIWEVFFKAPKGADITGAEFNITALVGSGTPSDDGLYAGGTGQGMAKDQYWEGCTYTYGAAPVEKSDLTQLSRFWKANTSQVEDGVDFKVRSTITRAKLAERLGVDDAGLEAAIKKNVDYVGFAMAENKAISDDDIKLAAKTPGVTAIGSKSGKIVVGLNQYVVNDGTNIQFGAVVHTAKSHLTNPAYYTAFIVLNNGTVIRYADSIQIKADDFRAKA